MALFVRTWIGADSVESWDGHMCIVQYSTKIRTSPLLWKFIQNKVECLSYGAESISPLSGWGDALLHTNSGRTRLDIGSRKWHAAITNATRAVHAAGKGTMIGEDGCAQTFESVMHMCVVAGLDLEVSTTQSCSRLPLPHHTIISAAYCIEDQGEWFFYLVDPSAPDARASARVPKQWDHVVLVPCTSAVGLVDTVIDTIVSTCPDFVVIHNGFKFDLPQMAASCSDTHAWRFHSVPLSTTDAGTDMYVVGVTFVDTLAHLAKLHKSSYLNLSLRYLATHFCLEHKLPMVEMTTNSITADNLVSMMAYNVTESRLHYKVATHSGTISEIVEASTIMSCPLGDAECGHLV